jgi:HSP20 family molecular chaperone IbpA
MSKTKEPLVEVIESDKTVSITSELLGVLKENIEL